MAVQEVFMVFGQRVQACRRHDAAREWRSIERRGSTTALQRINRIWGSARAGARLARAYNRERCSVFGENLKPHDAPPRADHERQSLLVSCSSPSSG
jgi:hypothetical protein